jgi:choline kinase
MKVIILAAGVGSRLGLPHPKTLTPLVTGHTILHHQLEQLSAHIDYDDIMIVVGFKKELIMEAYPDLTFIYNAFFDTTNTAVSLRCALRKIRNEAILLLNGDVIFSQHVIERLLAQPHSCMATNRAKVGDEEIKYQLDAQGAICAVSKQLTNALGEAVGINWLQKHDVPILYHALHACSQNDYFERGIELAISQGLRIYPADISDLDCVEIDFIEDLDQVNQLLLHQHPKK